ncbi:pilin [Patescibacteria group bacterium]|nr:pilin [Patescibacteria group bacterium]
MKKFNKHAIISLLTTSTLLVPSITLAQTIDDLTIKSGGIDTLKRMVVNIAGWVAGLAGTIALIYLIWGGVTYMTGGEKGAESGKKMITNAIIGLAIIALSVVIVNAVVGVLSL